MVQLKVETKVGEAIEGVLHEEKEIREYLGASQIGDLCKRRAWYAYRWYKTIFIKADLKRLFGRGHQEEIVLIKELKAIGVKVVSKQERGTLFNGHISGHNDGILFNVPGYRKKKLILECKTANLKNYTKFVNQGVEKGSRQYYIQMQLYMHMFGMKYALFVVTHKDTDRRYYEVVKYNKVQAKEFIKLGVEIINSRCEPRRLSAGSDWLCPYCEYEKICKFDGKAKVTCRSCKGWDTKENGKWKCLLKGKEISLKKQLKACKSYKRI